MKQKHYRVYLYPNANGICIEIAIWAIRGNATPEKWFTLQEMEAMFNLDAKRYTSTNEGYECHVFTHSLTIDYTKSKMNYVTSETEKETVCALMIEEIELFVLEPELPPYLQTENEMN